MAAIADDLERDALVDRACRARIDQQRVVGMAVDVDEAGRDDETGGIDTWRIRGNLRRTDRGDAVALDQDIGNDRRAAGAVMHLAAADQAPSLGIRTAQRGGDLAIATAYTGGAAQRAGLSAGDVLVAADGLRIDEKSLKALLSRRRPGDRIELHAFRRDELIRVEAILDAPARTEATLSVSTADSALRRAWLGERPSRPSLRSAARVPPSKARAAGA